MANASTRFALPFIQPGQAQKELFHNEALARVDTALHPVVDAMNLTEPPEDPALGAAWIVASDSLAEWAGHGDDIAVWTSGGWRFLSPVPGMSVWLRPAMAWIWYDGVAWRTHPLPTFGVAVNGVQVVGAQSTAIGDPAGGTVVDAESRAIIGLILQTMRDHGLIAP